MPVSGLVLVAAPVPSDVFVTNIMYRKVMAVVDARGRAPSPTDALLGIFKIPWRSSLQKLERGASHLEQCTFRGLPAAVLPGFAFLIDLSFCAFALAKSVLGDM